MAILAGRALKVFSTLAVQGAMPALAARYQEMTSVTLAIDCAPTNGLMMRIDAGEKADVAILTREAVEALVVRDVLAARSVVDVARSYVGIAVRAGAAKPDI